MSQPVKKQKAENEEGVHSVVTATHDPVRVMDPKKSLEASQAPSSFEQELSLTKSVQFWNRPLLEDFDSATTDISFQQLDAEQVGNESIVRFFGVTDKGNSVLCNVTGFKHYLYVPCPGIFRPEHIPELQQYLQEYTVCDIQIVKKESIWGYNGNIKTNFLKITVEVTKELSKLRTAFERGNLMINDWFPVEITTYDNIQYALRLMIDCGIVGMSWITLPKGKYSMVEQPVSTCQIEVNVDYKDLVSHPAEGDWSTTAPLRILSFDIECAGREGIFPEPEIDPVIQIANVVSVAGSSKPFVKNVFTVRSCAPITGSEIFSYEDEAEMLAKWKDFVVQVDPDVIIGYNTTNFDLPYLIDRAKALKIERFPFFGRLKHVKQEIKSSIFSSKAYGTRESKDINIDGRLQLDLLQFIQREYKLRSYSLNAVSAHFLGEQKEDVHHSIITTLFDGDQETRRRLAVYCLKDAYLPMRLLEKLMALVNYTEMARVTGVPFSYLLSRGQQIKVISQLFRKCLLLDIVIPNMASQGSDEQYEGATVIEPMRGYYDVPIATLDFNSLYPSIMMAHNLCYTSLLSKNTIDRLKLKEDEYIQTPNGDYFVSEKLRKGILPEILEELISARKRAKADLKKETDPFKRDVLNGRQLALKISANSVYGFTGATVGKLPCLAISSSVTAFGRQMIEMTKKTVEEHYTIANGYEHNAIVVYGDTDSVMVKFGTNDLKESMRLGDEAAKYVSSKFKKPINLEFEKCYFPYLLINKKRYAGLYWTNPDKYDKLDQKGLASVRRDSCPLVSHVMNKVLKMMLIDRNVNGALDYVKSVINDVLQNQTDISQLIISKTLAPNYTNPQPHAVLAARMKKRDAGSGPNVGDRVDYVITGGNDKLYNRAEDPLYVLEHSLPIDSKYYLTNQLQNPLVSIIGPILGEKQAISLFTIKSIKITTATSGASTGRKGGLMNFIKKVDTCKNCKKPISSGALCEDCQSSKGDLFIKSLQKARDLEEKYARLWTQCQRCVGSMHNEVLCSNKNCDIFYMRVKAKKDLIESMENLSKW